MQETNEITFPITSTTITLLISSLNSNNLLAMMGVAGFITDVAKTPDIRLHHRLQECSARYKYSYNNNPS